MNKARNISFYKIMTAGYISAEAYHALKPKTSLCELRFDECRNYSPSVQKCLESLFEDDDIIESLYLQEQLEQDLTSGNNQLISWINNQIKDNYSNILEVLKLIGIKQFLAGYLFSSSSSLYTRNFITEDNLEDIRLFINACREAYKKILKDREGLGNLANTVEKTYFYENSRLEEGIMASESFEDYYNDGSSIVANRSKKGHVTVDKDALSKEHPENEKYIIYLNYLDDEQFSEFEQFFGACIKLKTQRVFNCITSIGLREFCVNYLFANNMKLLNIPNLGKKSVCDCDLGGIREKVIEYINNHISIVDSSIKEEIKVVEEIPVFQTLKEKLGDEQYSVLQRELYQKAETLSTRPKKGIINYEGDFIEDFVHQEMDIKKIRNIGRKSEEEISHVVEYIKEMANNMSERPWTEEETFIIEKRNLYGNYLDNFSFEYFKKHQHLPMFHILENLIRKGIQDRDLAMLNSNTPLFEGEQSLSYEEIAANIDITRERVRQICNRYNKQLHSVDHNDINKAAMNYSKLLSQKTDWQYILDSTESLNWFDADFVDSIRQDEKCNLSKNFILLALSILCKENFEIVGADPLPIYTRSKPDWNNTYIVNRTITKAFDFDTFSNLLKEEESELTEDITLSVQEMLLVTFSKAWKNFDTNKEEMISELLTEILINEFGKIADDKLEFTLEGKKKVPPTDLMYKELSQKGNPMSAQELYDVINSTYPNRYNSPASIKQLVRADPRMCHVGTDNLISLIEWNHVKLGGVRDIIAQFLADFEQPQRLSDIVEHVQKHRETSEDSIRTTMGSGEQFVVFSGGYYGLKNKEYDRWYYLSEAEKNFPDRIEQLKQFIKDTGHFPFSHSEDAKEDQLYVWWNKVRNRTDLGNEQSMEVNEILQQYAMYPSSRKEKAWFDSCLQYKTFVERNGWKPSKSGYNEYDLYQWFTKATKDFDNGKLKPNQDKAYIKLCKSL